MKRIIPVLLFLCILFSAFSLSAYAEVERKYKLSGFNFTIPLSLEEDKEWAEANGYVNSWKTLDGNFEVMAGDYFYLDFGPVTLEEADDCRHFDEKNPESYESYTGGYDGDVQIGELTAEKIRHTVKTKDGKFKYYRYEFTNKDERLVLSFFVHDEEYEAYIDEILNTVTADKTPSFLRPEILGPAAAGVIAVAVFEAINRKREANNKK